MRATLSGDADRELISRIRAALREAADPALAPGMQA
jgi:hypothetical protein